MQFIDLKSQQLRIRDKIEQNINRVLNHGNYIMGPEINELEEKLGSFTGVDYAISCASGTDALLLALMAYEVKPGDAVFTTPFTFVATAEVIGLLGAVPVFVDIDPLTFNIDPEHLEKAIIAIENQDPSIYPLPLHGTQNRLKAKGIIPVDLFGLTADYDRINEIAAKHNLFVIEDAAQAFGAIYKGKRAGSLAHIGCTSFFPAKPLGCYGDGGMCFTNNRQLAEIMKSLRIHGTGGDKYDNVRIGINGRMDTLQAAILLSKFEVYPEEIKLRQDVAERYFARLSRLKAVSAPCIPEECISVWAQYSLLLKDPQTRAVVIEKLREKDIPTAIYYPKPLHLQLAFSYLMYMNGAFPVSEDFATRILSLPIHPYLDEAQQDEITEVFERFI